MNRDELLNEVRRRQRAAGSKVTRLQRDGVNLRGTKLDPRRDMARVKNYNVNQLRSYLGRLNEFTSRSTKFVPGLGGTPLPLQRFNALQHETRMYNIRVQREYDKVRGISLPRGQVLDPATGRIRPMTIEERDATLRPKNFITAGGEASSRPYTERDFPASRITGLDALDRFTNDMRRRNRKTYSETEIKRQRNEAKQMVLRIGEPALIDKMEALTNAQFDTLWNYSRFADDISLRYEHIVAMAAGTRDRSYETVLDNNSKDLQDMFRWAYVNLPEEK